MKKIISLLFLFLLCIFCYYIYKLTEDKTPYILSIGDSLANNSYLKNNRKFGTYNTDFTSEDYRIVDLLNTIKYNQEISKGDSKISIHRLLKKSDVLIISIGMNDLYYKLNDNTKEIYTYLNNMLTNYESLLAKIAKYDYQKVYVLGYYNIHNKQSDIFTYINYKLSILVNSYGYTYLDLNKILHNNPKYLEKKDYFYLNSEGYRQIYNLIVENFKKT